MKLDIKPLAEAIDRYLAKADDDLEKTLSEEGFVETKAAVKAVGRIEDKVVEYTHRYFDEVIEMIGTEEGLKQLVDMTVPEYDSIDELEADLKILFRREFDRLVRTFTFSYLDGQDPGLGVTDFKITRETQDTIIEWSRYLAGTTTKWVEPGILNMIHEAVKAGEDVDGVTKILYESGIRDTEWKARRLALTEVLRMESIGQQESFVQNPSCYKKAWVYTWQAKDPRQNHIAMNGQEVFKREPFTLTGKGGTYYPMYPRDASLPAGESINCHCTMKEIVDKQVLGMSKEDRIALREKYMDEVDAEWDEAHAHEKVGAFRTLTDAQKDRYFGGKGKGEPYRSLIDSGAITRDDELDNLYWYDSTGRRRLRGLQDLRADGIYTIDDDVLGHSVNGSRSKKGNPRKQASMDNGGMIKTGGHSQKAIDFLDEHKIPYGVEKTYQNGVRVGWYATASDKTRRYPGGKQAWFPEDWSDRKIRDAGTFAINRYSKEIQAKDGTGRLFYYANYDGVTVGVMTDKDRRPITIFPDNEQRLLGDSEK